VARKISAEETRELHGHGTTAFGLVLLVEAETAPTTVLPSSSSVSSSAGLRPEERDREKDKHITTPRRSAAGSLRKEHHSMGENHNDVGAELAALKARVDKLERHSLMGAFLFGDPEDVAEFLKAHPEHADLAAEARKVKEASRRHQHNAGGNAHKAVEEPTERANAA
jgi:hypothetical protein